MYSISLRQQSNWTRDKRVSVVYRTLRYPPSWPQKPAQEKGVDVILAVNLVKAAQLGTWDVVILATHDTDLEPALEMAVADGSAKSS